MISRYGKWLRQVERVSTVVANRLLKMLRNIPTWIMWKGEEIPFMGQTTESTTYYLCTLLCTLAYTYN